MPLFEMYRELKGVEPYLLTQKEYAVLVRAAAKKLIPGFIEQREAARRDLRAWEAANPEPNGLRATLQAQNMNDTETSTKATEVLGGTSIKSYTTCLLLLNN